MIKNNFQEEDTEVEVGQVVKKEKRTKTKEERSRDRRAVFWVLLFVLIITIVFWLKAIIFGKNSNPENFDDTYMVEEGEKIEKTDSDRFYIKYKI